MSEQYCATELFLHQCVVHLNKIPIYGELLWNFVATWENMLGLGIKAACHKIILKSSLPTTSCLGEGVVLKRCTFWYIAERGLKVLCICLWWESIQRLSYSILGVLGLAVAAPRQTKPVHSQLAVGSEKAVDILRRTNTRGGLLAYIAGISKHTLSQNWTVILMKR